jgi:hypothetical protein
MMVTDIPRFKFKESRDKFENGRVSSYLLKFNHDLTEFKPRNKGYVPMGSALLGSPMEILRGAPFMPIQGLFHFNYLMAVGS